MSDTGKMAKKDYKVSDLPFQMLTPSEKLECATYEDVRAHLTETVREFGFLYFTKFIPAGIYEQGMTALEILVRACEESFADASPTSLAMINWWAAKNYLEERRVFVFSPPPAAEPVKEK